MDKKVSISIFNFQTKYGDKKALQLAKELGADGVDFNLLDYDKYKPSNPYAMDIESMKAYFLDIKKYADELGIKIAQTHGRITGFKNVKEEDDKLIENGELDCIATALLGAKYCVMHTTTTIFMGPDANPDLMHQLNYDMYARLLPFAKRENIKIATETFGDAAQYGCIDFFGDADNFVKGYEKVKNESGYGDWFCVCMDTGHTNKSTRFDNNPPVADFIKRLGSSIEVLHLNDNDTFSDQHKIPQTGSIDWNSVMDALDEIGYNGYYNMEVILKHFGTNFDVEEARFAIKVMKNLLATKYSC